MFGRKAGKGPGAVTGKRPRRGFLRAVFGSLMAVGFWALGAAGLLWTAAVGRLMIPNVTAEPASRFRAGVPADYPRGHVETRFQPRFGVWVVHGRYRGRDQLFALQSVCTHLGCITLWQEREGRFVCPCHGSSFDREGFHLEGPAPRPLERCAIAIADDGQLEIDVARTYRQEWGQWDDPASFVEA